MHPSAPSTRCLNPPQSFLCSQAAHTSLSVKLAEDNLLRTGCSANDEAQPFAPAVVKGVPGKQAFRGCLSRAMPYPGNQTQSQVLQGPRLQPSTGQNGERR